jgi:multidrug efflux pump
MGRFNLSAWAVQHPPLVLFLILMLAAAGTFSYLKLGRAEDPNFTIKVAVVTTIWPGATAQEMQDQVADPIEKKLQELPYFNEVTTYTKPSFTAMQVEFKDSTPPSEVPQLFYQLRKKLDDVRPDLPANLIGPDVNDEYGDVDSMLYMLTADGADYAQLKRVAETMRQKLLKVENVTKVNLYGVQDEKIFVEFSHAKLATLGISPQTILYSLAKQNSVTPAGTVETSAQRVALRVTGAVDGAKAVADTPVESGGSSFRLGDIATVTRGFEDPPSYLVYQRGKPALGIGIVMAKGANILKLGEDVEVAVKQIEASLPQGIDLEQIADQPHVVDYAIDEFTKAFAEALGIVLLVSFISLGWRTGIVVALSVPLVLAITFIVMYTIHLDLHRITLGALIIALVPARRRRYHCRRDDDREDGTGLGAPARRLLRLDLDRLSDADWHAGDGGWLFAGRLRQFGGRRICRRHFLGRCHRFDRELVRGCFIHALSRREASARLHQNRGHAR